MKKRMLHLGLIGIMSLGIAVTAMAAPGAGRNSVDGPQGGKGKGCRMDAPGDPMARLVEKLDLSEAQQQQADKIFVAHREQADKLHKQMTEARGKLHQAMNPKNFDEKALRQAAAEKAKIQTELMVGRARTHSQIYALLTPEQQELADLARNLKRLRGDGPRGFRDCSNPMGPRGAQQGN
jgi:protein CpxP